MKISINESNYNDLEDMVQLHNAALYRGTASLSYRDKMLSRDLTVNSEGECGFALTASDAFGYGYAVVEFKLNEALYLKKTDNPSKEDYLFLLSQGVDGLLWRDFVIMIKLDKLTSAKTRCVVSSDRSCSELWSVPADVSGADLVRIEREDFLSVLFIPSCVFDSKCSDSSIVLCDANTSGRVRIRGTYNVSADADYGYVYKEWQNAF